MRASALVALGLVVGLVVAQLHHTRYRAQASLVVAPALQKTDPALRTITATAASLVRSNTVAVNVIAALHLSESSSALLSQIGAHVRPGTAIVDITATRGSAVDAQRVAQEVLVVYERIANARLGTVGSGPAVQVFDAPDDNVRALGRPYAAWGIGGASIGLLLGAALLLVPRRRAAPVQAPKPVPEPEPEPQLEEVSDTVTVSDTLVAAPPPVAEAPPTGLLGRLRAQVDAEPDPDRQAELAVYYDQFAPFATPDGELPANLIGLVEDVFGERP